MLIVTYGLSWPGIREQILEQKGSSPLWGCKVYHSLEMLGGQGSGRFAYLLFALAAM